MEPDFTSSKLLCSRAHLHIREFQSVFRQFINKEPHEIRHDRYFGGVYEYVLVLKTPLPPHLSVVAFDIVNALRSALDHAVFDAASILGTHPKPKYTKFPFGESAEQQAKDLRRKGSQVPPELVDFLIAFQSYKGGNPVLWSLNELRNGKIHQTLAPAIMAPDHISINQTVPGLHTYIDATLNKWDPAKQELTYLRTRTPPDPKTQIGVALVVTFGQGTPHEGKAAMEVFNAALREVARICEAIEAETARLKALAAKP